MLFNDLTGKLSNSPQGSFAGRYGLQIEQRLLADEVSRRLTPATGKGRQHAKS